MLKPSEGKSGLKTRLNKRHQLPYTAIQLRPLPQEGSEETSRGAYRGKLREEKPALAGPTRETLGGGRTITTEWPGVGHESEEPTYAEPELFEWMLRQRLGQPSPDAGGRPR